MSDRKRMFHFSFGIIAGFVVASLSSNYENLLYSYPAREASLATRPVVTDKLNVTPPKDDPYASTKPVHEIRLLCWVMTSGDNLQSKASHVRATWGRRCDRLLFASGSVDHEFPTINIDVPPGREHLTAKTMQTFDYVYKHHLNDFDWFMKVDDDTYVIVDNLRYFLSSKSPDDPVYFGHLFWKFIPQGYHSGGGGYVLSQEALARYGTRNPSLCVGDGGAEDVEVGVCMYQLGVHTGDSRDHLGRSRFHCFEFIRHVFGQYPEWYYRYDAFGAKQGHSSVSKYAVTFHYVPPHRMYEFEFFIYRLSHNFSLLAARSLKRDDRSFLTALPSKVKKLFTFEHLTTQRQSTVELNDVTQLGGGGNTHFEEIVIGDDE